MYEPKLTEDSNLSLEEELSVIKLNGSVELFLEDAKPNEMILGELNEYEKKLVLWCYKKNEEVLKLREFFKDRDFKFNDILLKEMITIAYNIHRAKDLLQQSLCRRFPGVTKFEIRKGFLVVASDKTPEQIRDIKKNRFYSLKAKFNGNFH
jgi:hypothetical protein